jgi:poly(A) polymerase
MDPQEWMTDPRTQSVMKALGGYDEEPKALFVGGCVRNALMGLSITDIDIATIHRPDITMKILLEAGIRAIPTGLDHGTVTALVDDKTFEVTTLRRDVETDGRHAVIAFTDKWEEDAQRRDFTINTMLASVNGKIFDPTGQGLSDIEERKVVFVGVPCERIAEDYLRILRFFRFYGCYGKGEPDPTAMEACRAHADKVSKLSKERISQELLKILALPNVAQILDLMLEAGVMSSIRADQYHAKRMERFCILQMRYDLVDCWPRLALLSGFNQSNAAKWLIYSNEQKEKIAAIASAWDKIKPLSVKRMRALVYEYGNAVITQAYLLWLAIEDKNPELEILDVARYWQAPTFPITGNDLIASGMPPGRNLGIKLKALEEKWIKSDFKTLPKI